MADKLGEFLNAFHIDPKSMEETLVGQVEYFPDGRLIVIEVEPSFDAKLRDAVAAINAKAAIVEIVPSDSSDAEERALASKVTKRGEDTFFGAMNDYLKRYYAFTVG
jgi:hypothetical protein